MPVDVSSRSLERSSWMSNESGALGSCAKTLLMDVWPSVEDEPHASSIAALMGERFVSSNESPRMPTAP